MKSLLYIFTACASLGATVSSNLDFSSRYAFRGAAIGGQSLQPSVSVEHGATTATVWANRPVAKEASSEIDFTVSQDIRGIDLGVTAYTYPGAAKTTWEPSVGIARDIGDDFKVSLTALRDLTLRTTTVESRCSVFMLIGGWLESTLDMAVGAVRAAGVRDYAYWSAGQSVKYAFTPKWSATAAVNYTSSNDRAIERDVWSWRVGVAASF